MRKFILATLFAQLAVIGAIIWRYEQVVRQGLEFRVPCRAYDPRDPWHGRYLRSTVSAEVECVTNHVIVPPPSKWSERFGPGFVMVDKHSTTNIPPLLVYKDEEPTLNPPYWFSVEKVRSNGNESRWTVDLPNTLYIPEAIADRADKLLAEARSSGVTNRAVAVYRAWKGAVVITGIEIDGVPIDKLAKE